MRCVFDRGLAGCILVAVMILSGGACRAAEIVVGPYLQNPAAGTITVMWLTDEKCTSWVEYGEGEQPDRRATHSEHGLIDADDTIHRVRLEGLVAGREYSYRVCSKEIVEFEPYKVTYGETVRSEPRRFRMPAGPEGAVSFLVLNDIHERNDLLENLVRMSVGRPYDMVFLNGDILGHIEDEAQVIEHVLQPCSNLFAGQTPFIYVRGNHETRGRYARMLPNYLAMPGGRYYYSFDAGPVHVLVMDGGEDKHDAQEEYSGLVDFDPYREAQREWLEQEIRSEAHRRAAFRVVLVHMPPAQSQKWHGPQDLYDKWRPLFNEGRIDLMICGHTHKYAVVEPEEGVRDYPMVVGGAPREGQATVIQVDATAERLRVVMTRDDGEVVGRYEVNSPSVTSIPGN